MRPIQFSWHRVRVAVQAAAVAVAGLAIADWSVAADPGVQHVELFRTLAASGTVARSATDDDPPVPAPVPPMAVRHRLAYRFCLGQTVHYETVHTTTLTTRKGPIEETVRNETKSRKHYRVVSVADDGSATLELMFDRVQMTARFGTAAPVSVDTAKPDDCPPVYRGVVKTVGKPLARIRVSASGKLLESESLLPDEVEAEVSGLPVRNATPRDDPGKNALIPFPAAPVAVGDTWTDSFTAPVSVTRRLTRDIKILRKYKLQSVEGHVARITVDTVAVTPLRDPAIRAQLIQREPSGTIDFDLERGVIVSREATIDKTVLAPLGDDSFMRAESLLSEKLVDGDRVAQRPGHSAAP